MPRHPPTALTNLPNTKTITTKKHKNKPKMLASTIQFSNNNQPPQTNHHNTTPPPGPPPKKQPTKTGCFPKPQQHAPPPNAPNPQPQTPAQTPPPNDTPPY